MNNTEKRTRKPVSSPDAAPGRGRAGLLAVAFLLAASATLSINPGWSQVDSLTFQPDEAMFACHDSLVVSVMIPATITDLRGFTLVFEFDSAVLTPMSVRAGSLLENVACPHFFQWLNFNAVGDSIAVDGAGLGCSMQGPGEIVHLVFQGYIEGIGYLRCRPGRGILRDALNQSIPFECGEGTYDYHCAIPVARQPWWAIKVLYR